MLTLEFFNTEEEVNLWSSLFYRESIAGSDPAMLKRRIYEKRVENSKGERIVDFLAFALMPNHYHLFLREIREGGISLFMQKLGGYTDYFNGQHKRSGSLFQARYNLNPIKDDNQLIATFHYIHTNAVELWEPGWKDFRVKDYQGAIKNLYNYKYSSFLDYVGKKNVPSITNRGFLLNFFGGTENIKKETENWIKTRAGINN